MNVAAVMTLRSLISIENQLVPIEVEFSSLPGLPNIQIVGLPDAVIKESVVKIKSAIKQQGFEFPRGRSVVVNLRPSHIRKSSQGLELAIATGILLFSGQIQWPESLDPQKSYFYGEINLQGEAFCPPDIQGFDEIEDGILVTGINSFPLGIRQYQIPQLSALNAGEFILKQELILQRPEIPKLHFTPAQARLLSIIGLGEHPTLLAGPAGSGKSTFVSAIPFLLRPPTQDQFREINRLWRDKAPLWRPVVSPHHSVTTLGMIGGGVPPRFGDATRAQGGTLVMDEFLEYKNEVFEALREPLETGQITISRSGYEKTFPARFLLLATTNLCKCGNYVPIRNNKCTCNQRRRELYFSRLNGPVLDRLAIIAFSGDWKEEGKVELEEVLVKIEGAIEFARKTRNQELPNHYCDFSDLTLGKSWLSGAKSRRRSKFFYQVLRSIADLDGEEKPKPFHIEEAANLCLKSHQLLTTQIALY